MSAHSTILHGLYLEHNKAMAMRSINSHWVNTLNPEHLPFTMSKLLNLSQVLSSQGQPPVAFEQLVKFVAFASRLKNDILLAQHATFNSAGDRCHVLPLTIQGFLSEACSISLPSVIIIWEMLAQTTWNTDVNISPVSGRSLWEYKKFGYH